MHVYNHCSLRTDATHPFIVNIKANFFHTHRQKLLFGAPCPSPFSIFTIGISYVWVLAEYNRFNNDLISVV